MSHLQAEREKYVAVRKWFISLSELRGKERSLLYGDYYSLHSSPSSLAFLRLWDQSERYITAVNWGATSETLTLKLAPTGKFNRNVLLSCIIFSYAIIHHCLTEGGQKALLHAVTYASRSQSHCSRVHFSLTPCSLFLQKE